ncbi:MAG: hypothetical protein KBA26_11990 [Candidatus Delongbacteria bacterium]|nr:hypothetical protein [Candidatus Delongbacteria bacterium]
MIRVNRLLLFLLSICLELCYGQNQPIDTVKNIEILGRLMVLDSFEHSMQAESELIAQLQQDSSQLLPYYSLGLLNFKNKSFAKALQYTNAGLSKATSGIDSLRFTMLKSEILLSMKLPEDAIQCFTCITVQDYPLFVSYYHYLIGRCYFQMKDIEQSRNHFTLLNQDIRYSKLAAAYLEKLERSNFNENQ